MRPSNIGGVQRIIDYYFVKIQGGRMVVPIPARFDLELYDGGFDARVLVVQSDVVVARPPLVLELLPPVIRIERLRHLSAIGLRLLLFAAFDSAKIFEG